MSEITAIFSDIGGVLLTNGWDHNSRRKAAEVFELPWEEFEAAHAKLADALDKGTISVDQYIDAVVFNQPRSFNKEEFYRFMKEQSVAFPDSLAIMAGLADSRRVLLATINNESRQLNGFRIDKFGLAKYFQAFFSSCYLNLKKPEKEIFERVLLITQKKPEETIFIDDRKENLVNAKILGMNTIHFLSDSQGPDQLRNAARQLVTDLAAYGVNVKPRQTVDQVSS